jgi:hypothetical protein
MKKILPLLLISCFIFISHHSDAQTRERLIAVCEYTVGTDSIVFTPFDSTTYCYSGTRSIDTSWSTAQAYDTSVLFVYAHSGYRPSQKYVNTWATPNWPQTDTVWDWDTVANRYQYKSFSVDSFNANNLPVQSKTWTYDTTGAWTYSTNEIKIYTAGNLPSEYIYQNSTGNTTFFDSVTYNSANQVVSLLERSVPVPFGSLFQINSYDSLGRMDTMVAQMVMYDSVNFTNMFRNIYTYDTNNNLSLQIEQGWRDSVWATNGRISYSYDAHHNRIGYIQPSLDTSGHWVNFWQYTATFDTFNMITSSVQLRWDTSGTWVPMQGCQINHYYYETYSLPIDTTGIATITASGDVRIYPVPAADMLSVDIHWTEAQQAIISVYDMNGRKCGEWPTACATSWHGYIPIASLPAGAYTMLISGPSGSIRRAFNIVR